MSVRSSIIENWEVVTCPLLGGSRCIKAMLNSIRAIGFVRYIETVRSSEGPLWEVSPYIYIDVINISMIIVMKLTLHIWLIGPLSDANIWFRGMCVWCGNTWFRDMCVWCGNTWCRGMCVWCGIPGVGVCVYGVGTPGVGVCVYGVGTPGLGICVCMVWEHLV